MSRAVGRRRDRSLRRGSRSRATARVRCRSYRDRTVSGKPQDYALTMDSLITLPAPANGSKLRPMVGAVIYIRVSTKEQTENLSLSTQLKACEEYCERQGFEVLARFREEGESAKTADRTELQKLLHFCRTNKGRVQFVVVFNLTRFAREKYDHFALRAHLKSLGISPSLSDRAHRRHVHRKADGGRACRIRAVRQRRALRENARRHAGGPGTRTLDVSRSPWLPQRSSFNRQKPGSRSRPSVAGAPRVP